MMKVKNPNRYFLGLANLGDVASEVCNLPESEAERKASLSNLYCELEQLVAVDEPDDNALALIAAAFNARFAKTGYLYSVGDGGTLERKYYMEGQERQVILKMGDF